MGLLKDNIRVWWKRPQDLTQRNVHREVSMLELFYDLSYVTLIIQITPTVVDKVCFASGVMYISLFSIVYWAWFNGSLYHEYYGNLDLKTRLIIFIQMFILVGIGINIKDAFGSSYKAFAFFVSIFFFFIFISWLRVIQQNEKQKQIVSTFTYLQAFTSLSFFISMFTRTYISYTLWFIAILIPLVYSVIFIVRENSNVDQEALFAFKNIGESFVERFGLLATIILGEGVSALVEGGTKSLPINMLDLVHITSCFILIVCVWWLYFDFISRRLPKKDNISKGIWLGFHLPLLVSLGLICTAILNLLEVSDIQLCDRLLLVIPLIVFLISCMGLKGAVQVPDFARPIYKTSYHKKWIAVFGLVLVAMLPLTKTFLLVSCVVCLVIPIRASFRMWIEVNRDISMRENANKTNL